MLLRQGTLLKQNPELAKEWHPTKNGSLTPDQVTPASGKKVWWQCENGHEWQAIISNRAKGIGCPYCSGQRAAAGQNDLLSTHPLLVAEWDFEKNTSITPSAVSHGSEKRVWWKCANGHEWQARISDRAKGTGCPECAKAIRGRSYSQTMVQRNRFSSKYPSLAAQWHQTKNGSLAPDSVTSSSNKKVWWQCENGHEWQAVINSRVKGSDCPFCSVNRARPSVNDLATKNPALPGVNDLATKNPALAKQWHPSLNDNLTPSDVTVSSGKKVWWRCENGHEWQAIIANRTKGSGCPYCSGKKPVAGKTDLFSKNPELAAEWHPTKNGSLLPSDVTASSGKKVWWQCENGHEWEAAIYSRNSGRGCPFCRKRH